jgi:orotidine-5'-phosphate decarboxylase
MSPKDAINLGANFLVIGRPITEAENIKEALLEIYNSL